MVGWHHQFDGHEFELTPGDSEGEGSLECCSPWGHKESDMTEKLNANTIRGGGGSKFPSTVGDISSLTQGPLYNQLTIWQLALLRESDQKNKRRQAKTETKVFL